MGFYLEKYYFHFCCFHFIYEIEVNALLPNNVFLESRMNVLNIKYISEYTLFIECNTMTKTEKSPFWQGLLQKYEGFRLYSLPVT